MHFQLVTLSAKLMVMRVSMDITYIYLIFIYILFFIIFNLVGQRMKAYEQTMDEITIVESASVQVDNAVIKENNAGMKSVYNKLSDLQYILFIRLQVKPITHNFIFLCIM